jgi:hypothetical protein
MILCDGFRLNARHRPHGHHSPDHDHTLEIATGTILFDIRRVSADFSGGRLVPPAIKPGMAVTVVGGGTSTAGPLTKNLQKILFHFESANSAIYAQYSQNACRNIYTICKKNMKKICNMICKICK